MTDFGTSRLMPSVAQTAQMTMCDLAPLPFRFSIDDANVDPSAIVTMVMPPSRAPSAVASSSNNGTTTATATTTSPNTDKNDAGNDENPSPSYHPYSVAANFAFSLSSSSALSQNSLEGDEGGGKGGNGMTLSNSMLLLSSSASATSNPPKSSSFRSVTHPIQDFFREAGHSLASYIGRPERGNGNSVSVPLLPSLPVLRMDNPEASRAPSNPDE